MKRLAVVLLSAVTAFAGVAPAQAFPVVKVQQIEAPRQIENVQWRDRGDRWRHGSRHYRDGRYYRHRDRHYGHRNYRHRHHRGSNAGAIIGGLAAGAIIGGALAQQQQPRYVEPRRYVSGSSHTQWCYDRYRSYRAYDNTFQPYNGPRRQCYSPFR
jgi:hypothetical protein